MRRALIAALVLASSVASADEPAEDPKAAIAERGIVLQASKKHFFVVLPPATVSTSAPTGAKLHNVRIFFGDAKTLVEEVVGGWTGPPLEHRDVIDVRSLYSQTVEHANDAFTLRCYSTWDGGKSTRIIPLTPAKTETMTRAVIRMRPQLRTAYVLARTPGAPTYYYVDRLGAADSTDFRVFMGKRGAMKPVAVKEVAKDSNATILVTAKGSLTLTEPQTPTGSSILTLSTAKKTDTLDILPIRNNRKLIYLDLGIYTRVRTGQPCDEL